MTTRNNQLVGLALWIGLSIVAALLGGMASMNAGEFYMQLHRPSWAPPGWLFGPVWSLLYLMMAFSAWLVWREVGFKHGCLPLTLYLLQLAFNIAWSWLFFVLQSGLCAFFDVVVLCGMLLATLIAFWRVHALAGLLLLPYLAWVSFATALTFAVWQLNPMILGHG